MINLEQILSLDPKATHADYKKGEIIQRAGDHNPCAYYVKKGLLRAYLLDSNGKEHIYMFAPEEWVVADIEAVEFNEPAQLYVDCLEDTEVIKFDKDCVLKQVLPQEEILNYCKLLFRRIARLQRRVLMLMGSPAVDRYNYFLQTYPQRNRRGCF